MKIKVNIFDPDSIEDAINELEESKDELHKKVDDFIEELTIAGLIKATELIPVDTGEAQNSIDAYIDEETGHGIIKAGGYCKFIEFGTGVIGKKDHHPSPEYMAIMKWAYGVGATIHTTEEGKTGWFYPDDDGNWRFTEGMPSRPFMYDTAQFLKREAIRMIKDGGLKLK